MIILWVLLVIAVIWAITESARAARRNHYHDHGPSQSTLNTGLDILNERYAKGDITKEEYDQKKKDILGR